MRAAQYVRMSTEHQQYSTENQADAIRQYADRHGYEIVRDEDLLLGRREIDPKGGRKYAIQLSTTELTRARGGPHCMTMPLVRERLG